MPRQPNQQVGFVAVDHDSINQMLLLPLLPAPASIDCIHDCILRSTIDPQCDSDECECECGRRSGPLCGAADMATCGSSRRPTRIPPVVQPVMGSPSPTELVDFFA